MVGDLAQIIALASHGNAYLSNDSLAFTFYPESSVFQGCKRVTLRTGLRDDPVEMANEVLDPLQWFGFLSSKGCKRLFLARGIGRPSRIPDHVAVAFVGGGTQWFIGAQLRDRTLYWAGTSTFKGMCWEVEYEPIDQVEIDPQSLDLDGLALHRSFHKVLMECESLASRNKYDNFARCFSRAISSLQSEDPIAGSFQKDLLPAKGYGLLAKQLITACNEAWVFGGMGSWNDLYFESEADGHEYSRLSSALYSTINNAIEWGTNSYES